MKTRTCQANPRFYITCIFQANVWLTRGRLRFITSGREPRGRAGNPGRGGDGRVALPGAEKQMERSALGDGRGRLREVVV
eukprot:249065-Prorocentrum_minimum.AAC.1